MLCTFGERRHIFAWKSFDGKIVEKNRTVKKHLCFCWFFDRQFFLCVSVAESCHETSIKATDGDKSIFTLNSNRIAAKLIEPFKKKHT